MDYYYVSNNGASLIYHWAKQPLQSSQPVQPSPSTQVVQPSQSTQPEAITRTLNSGAQITATAENEDEEEEEEEEEEAVEEGEEKYILVPTSRTLLRPRYSSSSSYESRNKESMAMNNSAERPRAPRSLSDTSTSTMVRNIIVKDHRGQDKFMHARLDCGADANFMSEEKALILGHKLERYNGPDFNMGIGQLQPIYQIYVTWTFNLPDKRSSKSFDDRFLVVKDAMFDVILGEMVLFGKKILLKNPEFFFLTINPVGKDEAKQTEDAAQRRRAENRIEAERRTQELTRALEAPPPSNNTSGGWRWSEAQQRWYRYGVSGNIEWA